MKTAKTKKKAAILKAPEGIKVSKGFEITLSDAEIKEVAAKGAALHMNYENTLMNFNELKKEWGAKLKTLAAQHAETQYAITAGKEKRVVDAIMVKDYDTKEVTYFVEGDGTWDKMETRTMTAEEVQMELDEFNKKQPRAKKQAIKKGASENNLSGMGKTSDEEIGEVIKMETSRRTKRSAVDGKVAEGVDF